MEDVADYAMLIKVYRAVPEGERRYSPAEVAAAETVPVSHGTSQAGPHLHVNR